MKRHDDDCCGSRAQRDDFSHEQRVMMSRAPPWALLFALALGSAATAGAACAAPRVEGDAQAGAASVTLVLSKTAIAAAVRRTAVADPDLDGEVSSLEAAE